jgi:hypothetical protein
MTSLFDRFMTAAKQTGLKVEKTTFKQVKIGSPYFTENNGLLIKVSISDISADTAVYIAK